LELEQAVGELVKHALDRGKLVDSGCFRPRPRSSE